MCFGAGLESRGKVFDGVVVCACVYVGEDEIRRKEGGGGCEGVYRA